MAAALVDTNVLVYGHDPRDRRKQAAARDLLRRLYRSEQAVVSVQSLSEFSAAVRRLPQPLTSAEAAVQVERIARASRVVDLTVAIAFEGLRAADRHSLSIWDALIWAAAKLNQVPTVLSEDFRHGRTLEGVRFLDPFDRAFDLALLG